MAFADPIHADGADACPECGAPLVLRLVGAPGRRRRRFWGCSTFPVTGCRGSRTFEMATADAFDDWTRAPRRRSAADGHDGPMTHVAMSAMVGNDYPHSRSSADHPTPVSDAPSRRAARHSAAADLLGRGYHRHVDQRISRFADRWPLLLMAYVGYAGGSVMATWWIHPAVAGVALMSMTALFIEAIQRQPEGSTSPQLAPTNERDEDVGARD